MKNKSLLSRLASLTPLLSLAAVVCLQQRHLAHLKTNTQVDYAREAQSIKFALDLQRQLPLFGFDNAIADWTFLKYVQYHGDIEARKVTGYKLIPEFFETMVSTDPRFVEAYLSLSTANSIFAGRPDKTVAFMNRVLQSVSPKTSPLAHFIWIYKGIDEILFIGDMKEAKNSYEMAAKWARIAGAEIIAARARETANFLASNPNSTKIRISAWAMILTTTNDRLTQEYASQKIKELGGQIIVTSQGELQIKMPSAS